MRNEIIVRCVKKLFKKTISRHENWMRIDQIVRFSQKLVNEMKKNQTECKKKNVYRNSIEIKI